MLFRFFFSETTFVRNIEQMSVIVYILSEFCSTFVIILSIAFTRMVKNNVETIANEEEIEK